MLSDEVTSLRRQWFPTLIAVDIHSAVRPAGTRRFRPVLAFAVFTGVLAGTAARTILLAGAATTVGVDDQPDIFAERIGGAAAGIGT